MAVNFHKSPFGEGTQTKLDLFSAYAKEWLPVFLSQKHRGATVTIVDFFAGPGRDVNGLEGSPLCLLRRIREYTQLIRTNDVTIRLELNEGARRKSECLKRIMEEQNIPPSLCQWRVSNLPFQDAFDLLYPTFNAGPNLIFMDQQGMKFISDSVFQRIIALEKTDFLFFIASSFIRRFWDHEYFKKHLPIPAAEITGRAFSDTHRAITEYYQSLVTKGKPLFLAPFSIKKGSNIYGVIFGSAHTLGILKFLRVCWDLDSERGEANFDIDGDAINPNAPYLFDNMNVASKINRFEKGLRAKISDKSLVSDAEVYLECLKEGMLPKHGRTVLSKMIKDRVVRVKCGRRPRISEDGLRDSRVLEILSQGETQD